MQLSIDDIAALPPSLIRMGLPPWVASRLANDPTGAARASSGLQELMSQASDEEIQALQQSFTSAGQEYQLYPANPLARKISRIFLRALTGEHTVVGREHLEHFLALPGRKMLVCNHLSYTDTQVTDTVLDQLGLSGIADRLVAVAGPKVYTETWRRMAAISLNTRKTPQSTSVATEISLPPREVARLAMEAIEDCGKLMDQGYIILLYPEGTRSRDQRMQSFLKASARYTALENTTLLPLAQTGTERIFPIDDPMMYTSPVRLRFGPPQAHLPGRTEAITQIWHTLSGLLPEAYQPAPETLPLT